MKIVLIGSGNLATHLGLALVKSKHSVLQVYGRGESAAKSLSKKLSCKYTTEIKSISAGADLYIVALRDEAIETFLKKFPFDDSTVVHTSGSVSLKVFGKKYKNSGVFYPVQTFSIKRAVNFKNIPVCIEASNAVAKRKMVLMAKAIAGKTHFVDSEQRKKIHLAAVFANNFTNHLFAVAQNILSSEKISFDVLKPLIMETALKIQETSPLEMQTGPAQRGDTAIITEHLKMLSDKKRFKEIYKTISESILELNGIRL